MSEDLAVQLRRLTAECRQRAALFVEEGQYYGWQLRSVQTKPLGDFTQCTLDFGRERIVFLCQRKVANHAAAQA